MLRIRGSRLRTAIKVITPIALVVGTVGFVGLNVYDSSPAKALNMQFNLIGTHPRASALYSDGSFYSGAELRDMAIQNGKLYAGYGDWNGNSDSWGPAEGRTAIVPFDIASRTFDSQNETLTGSEANYNFRSINGFLYAPSIDPSIHGAGGYATNESGSWQVKNAVPNAVHVFDVASLNGSDLWLFGARDDYPPGDGSVGQAIAWRSTDGGTTWNEAQADASAEGESHGFERYYWGQKAGNKVFMQAQGTTPESPMRSFDGTTWQTYPGDRCEAMYNRVVTFNDKIICGTAIVNGSYVNGATIDQDGLFTVLPDMDYINDFYVDGGYLYAINSQNQIKRTNDLSSWEDIGTFSEPYTIGSSLAVSNDHIYIGTNDGRIFESNLSITDNLAIAGPDTCLESDGYGTITNYYSHENDNPANPLCSLEVVIPDEINGVTTTSIGSGAFQGKGLTSVVIPDTVTTIDSSAFSYNDLTAVELPSALTTLNPYAFYNNKLQSVTVPTGVTRLTSGVFADNDLTSITLHDGIDRLEDYALWRNDLTSIDLPDSLSFIRGYALSENKLTSIAFPDSIVSIGENAFSKNQLSTLMLPNSVTQVADGAFSNNLISSLSLSDTLTDITKDAFANNRIRQVVIPNSVTSIDDSAFIRQSELSEPSLTGPIVMDGLSADGQPTLEEYLDSIWYVRLYTQDPSNPNGLVSGAHVEKLDETQCIIDDFSAKGKGSVSAESGCGTDYNQDGDTDDVIMANYGGHLINPAFVAISSETESGKDIAAVKTLTGKGSSGFFTSYMVKDGPRLEESPMDAPINSTSANVGSLAAGDPNTITLTDGYFKVGQTIQVPASMFPGYSLASGSSLVSITLTSAVNAYTFVYELTNPGLIPGAPNTGGGVTIAVVGIIAALTVMGVALLVLIRRKKATI